MVKKVTVINNRRVLPNVIMSSASTKSKWSTPIQICFTPSEKYPLIVSSADDRSGTFAFLLAGCSINENCSPFNKSTCTNTSTMVSSMPVMVKAIPCISFLLVASYIYNAPVPDSVGGNVCFTSNQSGNFGAIEIT